VLTNDLLRVRRSSGNLVPRYLRGKVRKRVLPATEQLVEVLASSEGRRREALTLELDSLEHHPSDRVVMQGLRKLALDRCDFDLEDGIDPIEVRRRLFHGAAARRRELGARDEFDRDAALDDAAAALECERSVVEDRLFADLKQNERLVRVKSMNAQALLQRYDVALAQGILLRATRVDIALQNESPGRVRQLFRDARFHGLLHRVQRVDEGSYLIELDGPLSLFSAVQKYGFKLALFLPSLLRCKTWQLRAEVLWGKQREASSFELSPRDELVPYDKPMTGVAPELAKFLEGFRKLKSKWTIDSNEHIFALPGEVVCIPDFVFTNSETGEEVFLEAFGFWSRAAVWQRIETIERGFPSRIILALGKQLRVSEEALSSEQADQANLYVYKTKMRPKAVLERLEAGS
jgi:predicted nuclease of restriction endonuclease-like RecB superfamily